MAKSDDRITNFTESNPRQASKSAMGRFIETFRKTWIGYLFLLPALLIYISFVFIPFLKTIYLSGFSGVGTKATQFVGLANYVNLFTNPIFWESFTHNIMWAAMVLVVPVSFGLFLAVLLSRSQLWGRTVFRTILFLPQVITSVVVAMIWRWMYNVQFGPVNVFLRSIGLDNIARGWLGDHTFALPALAIGYSWAYYGFCMVVFLAALQGIDDTLYDAAKIDGANSLQEFWYVTLPGLRFALSTVLLFTLIESFKIFDIVFIATVGGPGYSTWVISYFLYDYTWNQWNPGMGLASATIQTTFIAAITIIFLWYRRRQQTY
jgi:raffinose/stachyose/melibiose transport system permease protein